MERWTENVAKHSHLHHHRAAVHNVAVWLWQSARWWPKRSIWSGTRSQGKALECQHRLAVTSWAHCHYHLSPSKQHHDPKNSQGLWWNDGCEFAYGYNMSARMCVCMRYFAIPWRSVFFFVASTVAMYANRLITSSPINNCDLGGQLRYLLWWKVTKTSELSGSDYYHLLSLVHLLWSHPKYWARPRRWISHHVSVTWEVPWSKS